MNGHSDVVELLLDAPNSDVNIKNALSETPLHSACRSGNFEVVEQLLYYPHILLNEVHSFRDIFPSCKQKGSKKLRRNQNLMNKQSSATNNI